MADLQGKLVTHLQDAYALEQMVIETLERHVNDAEHVPHVSSGIRAHIEESKVQAEMVKKCLASLEAEPSGMKSTMSSAMGAMQGMMPDMKGEPLVSNLKAEFATEHFEIACYIVIKAMAQQLGHTQIVETCDTIIAQEQKMADLVMQALPECAVMEKA